FPTRASAVPRSALLDAPPRARRETVRRSSRRRSHSASRCDRDRSAAGNASGKLPHYEAEADVVGGTLAEAIGDARGKVCALLFRDAGAVEPPLAERQHPGSDAMRERRRPLDQPRIDFSKSRGLVNGGKLFWGRIPVMGLDR